MIGGGAGPLGPDGATLSDDGGAAAEVIRTVVVDDEPLLREGIRAVLEREPDIVVVGAVEHERVHALLGTFAPDVLVLGPHVARGDGADAIQQLWVAWPMLSLVVLGGAGDARFHGFAHPTGVAAYLRRAASGAAVVAAVRAVADRSTIAPATPALATEVQSAASAMSLPHRIAPLTAREREVLTLVAAGKRDREIAGALFLSLKTVENHVRHVRHKLGVRTRTEAALLVAGAPR